MAQILDVQCKCGNPLIVQCEGEYTILRVYCKKCRTYLVNYQKTEKFSSTKIIEESRQATVVNQTAVLHSADQDAPEATVVNQTAVLHSADQDAPPSGTVVEKDASNPTAFQQSTPGGAGGLPKKEQLPMDIGVYTLVQYLGGGGMGAVYLASANNTGEKVAIKVMHHAENTELLDRFLREMLVLSQLNHPNIILLKGHGNFQGNPYIAMEYVEGTTLEAVLAKKGPLPPIQAVQIIFYILDALTYAAERKIVHRDIKPANIMVANTGVVKLIDLGLAKMTEDSLKLTASMKGMGTLYYMPPEQLQDAKTAGVRADIYAIGATLYHTLCGSPPFSEYKETFPLMKAKVEGRYQSLRDRAPHLPSELLEITKQAMEQQPEKRYNHPAEMKQKLLAFYRGQKK